MSEPETHEPSVPIKQVRRAARTLVRLELSLLAAGFAWFAYIDAPITDGAMHLFALAVLVGMLTLIAALIGSESRVEKAARRLQRTALWLFILAIALMLTAATVTLNLRGTGNDESDTQTSVVMRS